MILRRLGIFISVRKLLVLRVSFFFVSALVNWLFMFVSIVNFLKWINHRGLLFDLGHIRFLKEYWTVYFFFLELFFSWIYIQFTLYLLFFQSLFILALGDWNFDYLWLVLGKIVILNIFCCEYLTEISGIFRRCLHLSSLLLVLWTIIIQ